MSSTFDPWYRHLYKEWADKKQAPWNPGKAIPDESFGALPKLA